ncbi:hypothetical protein [Streptomonospora wellingtoniae]|uniref:Uncharacterized protein n=1 Tax=Streptomonospora wellingtoniae TaxID=3075544 RepID=A0ABU2KW56_9ACTN|nr:hypothetical protein [Streptomonospora sp. DSM 45055]MDT0303358.1 hypothetical protein [Streptomonospora sp. DSM 45055]
MRLLVTIGLTASALAVCAGTAGASPGITAIPETAAPGDSITLRAACAGPAERLEFTSRAFQGAPSAELVDGAGTVPVVVAPGTRPGIYAIMAECAGGSSTKTVEGELTVVRGPLTPTPFGAPQTGGGGAAPESAPPLLAAVAGTALLALGAAAAAYRRLPGRAR